MELTINVDETMFKEVLDKELKAFSEDELKQIVRDGLLKCMSNVDTFKDLFVTENKDSWSDHYKVVLKDLAYEAAKTIDYSPLFEDFKNDIISYIKENGQNIIKDLMLELFIGGLQNSLLYSGKPCFMDNLKANIQQTIWEDRNNNNQQY